MESVTPHDLILYLFGVILEFGTKWVPKVDFRGLENDSKKNMKKGHAARSGSEPLAPLKT